MDPRRTDLNGASNPMRDRAYTAGGGYRRLPRMGPGQGPGGGGDEFSALTQTGSQRWMIPYADFITVLLGVAFLMYGATAVMPSTDATSTETQMAQIEDAQGQPVTMMAYEGEPADQPNPESETPPKPLDAQAMEETLLSQLALSGQQVSVKEDARGLVISFQDRLFFDPGQATLTPSAASTLSKLADILNQVPTSIVVEGHTDNTPIKTAQYPSNWELSMARATTIVRSLIQTHHFDPKRLSATGYGEFQPIAENSTIEGKQKNRRVDIVLITAHHLSDSPTAPSETETGFNPDASEPVE